MHFQFLLKELSSHLLWLLETMAWGAILLLTYIQLPEFFLFGVNMQRFAGHTSPVESVAFNSGEVLVLAGASSGVTKIWDLEETKSKLAT